MAKEESSPKMISLKTADNVVFEVEPDIAKEMQTVQSFIEDFATIAATSSSAIPLPNVYSRNLKKIIEYLKQHRDNEDTEEFDNEWKNSLSHSELKELLLAVHYLNVKCLHNFLCQAAADLIKDKGVEFVRKYFCIENDYTPEEEAQVREEHKWAFEGADNKYED